MKQKVIDFFDTEFVDYSSYSTIRMISSAIDGLKNSHRKIIHTVLDKNIKTKSKVSRLASTVSEYTEYLNGDISGVIAGMGQFHTGTNNVPLLAAEGNYGNRFSNSPSAARYIYTHGTEFLFNVFKKEDGPILIEQIFEGHKIEPRFFLPSLPLLLINGSNGIASGFKQTIFGRDIKKVKKFLINRLKNNSKTKFNLKPYFEGFRGEVTKGEGNRWLFSGVIKRVSSTTIEITEIPPGMELARYIKILDDLKDKGKIINFKDNSDKNIFNFTVKFLKKDLLNKSDEDILNTLKLVKTETEIYNGIDEDLRVRTFKSTNDIMDYYIKIKLKYLKILKENLLDLYETELEKFKSKYLFIKAIVDGKLIINNRKNDLIIEDLEKINGIIKQNDSYNYLLNMPISSLTKEQMQKLNISIKNKKNQISELKNKSLNQIWLDDLENI